MTSRRQLLKGAVHGAAAAALARILDRPARGGTLPRVVVVGGGPAGLSAALELAERGVPVTLVEAANQLGGKVQGWTEPMPGGDATVDVEHGVHGWWHQYVHFRELLARYGLDEALRPFRYREHAMVFPDRQLRSWFSRVDAIMDASGRRGPGFLHHYGKGIRWLRRGTVAGLRAQLAGRSVSAWMADGPPLTVYSSFPTLMAWSMYFVAPQALDAATFALGERFYFTGTPKNDEVSWLSGNPQTLVWEPLAQALRARGGEIRLGSPVRQLVVEDGRVTGVRLGLAGEERPLPTLTTAWQPVGAGVYARQGATGPEALLARCTHAGCPVMLQADAFACPCHGGRYDLDGRVTAGPPPAPLQRLAVRDGADGPVVVLPDTEEQLDADVVILAVDAPALGRLCGELLPRTRGLKGTRAAVGRFWLDRDVARNARSAVLFEGFSHACNGFLVHRLQDDAAAWAAETGGSVIEIQAFRGLSPELSGDALLDAIQADLHRIWPETAGATVRKRHLTDESTFTWFFPGWQQHAVPVDPGVPGLLVAGDHVLVDRNAQFMELAVYTGRVAANHVLADAGLPQAPILPPRGGMHDGSG